MLRLLRQPLGPAPLCLPPQASIAGVPHQSPQELVPAGVHNAAINPLVSAGACLSQASANAHIVWCLQARMLAPAHMRTGPDGDPKSMHITAAQFSCSGEVVATYSGEVSQHRSQQSEREHLHP